MGKPTIKPHFKWQGLTFTSDSRDVCLSGELDADIYDWAKQNKINASIFMKADNNSVWRIKDDEERIVFKLTWGVEK